MQKQNRQQGFSIIEALMIISLVAVLASLGIVAINPVAHFALARNAQRWGDVNMLSNALADYRTDHEGVPPSSLAGTPHEICRIDVPASSCRTDGFVDLSLLVPTYLQALPTDPIADSKSGRIGSGYIVSLHESGRISVTALHAEKGEVIVVSR